MTFWTRLSKTENLSDLVNFHQTIVDSAICTYTVFSYFFCHSADLENMFSNVLYCIVLATYLNGHKNENVVMTKEKFVRRAQNGRKGEIQKSRMNDTCGIFLFVHYMHWYVVLKRLGKKNE
jgi:hypothetical protein